MGNGNTEDSLAYLRTEREYKNCLLVEQPNGDWAQTMLRQFLFSAYQALLYAALENHPDQQLAAIAAKSKKEVTYHLRWSSEWVIRLGDGTGESKQRMLAAIDTLWPYTGELFLPAAYEMESGINVSSFEQAWKENIKTVLDEAGLPLPVETFMQKGGKQGIHTEHLGYILTELQYMQRAYPNSQW
jgi:ring-1,2-phenylacetyl-CoA epoxidase subunit PaaC